MAGKTRSSLTARDHLLTLQKRVHRSLRLQAERLLGDTPESIRRYEREYLRDIGKPPKQPASFTKKELIEEIRRTQVSFIADFHTFAQSQRTALRLLRECVRPGENWHLGLEIFSSEHQPLLDLYQKDEIAEERFLLETNYAEAWGFPWAQYAPLLQWAKAHDVKLIALNRPRDFKLADDQGHEELRRRDRWAAGIITDIFAQARRPRPRMLVLYGELHLSQSHLPEELKKATRGNLKKPLKILCVHQNLEKLYWRLAQRGQELHTEIVRLKRAHYCVLSSTPWAKLQSLVNWVEGSDRGVTPLAAGAQNTAANKTKDTAWNEKNDEEWEFESASTDYLSLIRDYGKIVAEFFRLPPPSFDSLTLRTLQDIDQLEDLTATQLTPSERRLIRYHVLHGQKIYIPKPAIAFLPTPSENAAAEIASLHLFHSIEREPRFFEQNALGFYRAILESCFGFLGSLILNPKRKCDLIVDHEHRKNALQAMTAAQLKTLALTASAHPLEIEARQLAIAFLSPLSDDEAAQAALLQTFTRKTSLAAALYFGARYIGHALGKMLHARIMRDEISPEEIRALFFFEPPGPLPYWQFLALKKVATGAKAPSSKSENL